MKLHTSFKVGGSADYFIIVNNIDELKKLQKFATEKSLPFMVIGNGTNLLVRDKGIRGIVAKLNFNTLKVEKESERVIISGDYPVSKLSRKCAKLRIVRNRIFIRYSRNCRRCSKNECWSIWL